MKFSFLIITIIFFFFFSLTYAIPLIPYDGGYLTLSESGELHYCNFLLDNCFPLLSSPPSEPSQKLYKYFGVDTYEGIGFFVTSNSDQSNTMVWQVRLNGMVPEWTRIFSTSEQVVALEIDVETKQIFLALCSGGMPCTQGRIISNNAGTYPTRQNQLTQVVYTSQNSVANCIPNGMALDEANKQLIVHCLFATSRGLLAMRYNGSNQFQIGGVPCQNVLSINSQLAVFKNNLFCMDLQHIFYIFMEGGAGHLRWRQVGAFDATDLTPRSILIDPSANAVSIVTSSERQSKSIVLMYNTFIESIIGYSERYINTNVIHQFQLRQAMQCPTNCNLQGVCVDIFTTQEKSEENQKKSEENQKKSQENQKKSEENQENQKNQEKSEPNRSAICQCDDHHFYGDQCQFRCHCSGHGRCVVVGGDAVTCECDSGYSGPQCSNQTPTEKPNLPQTFSALLTDVNDRNHVFTPYVVREHRDFERKKVSFMIYLRDTTQPDDIGRLLQTVVYLFPSHQRYTFNTTDCVYSHLNFELVEWKIPTSAPLLAENLVVQCTPNGQTHHAAKMYNVNGGNLTLVPLENGDATKANPCSFGYVPTLNQHYTTHYYSENWWHSKPPAYVFSVPLQCSEATRDSPLLERLQSISLIQTFEKNQLKD